MTKLNRVIEIMYKSAFLSHLLNLRLSQGFRLYKPIQPVIPSTCRGLSTFPLSGKINYLLQPNHHDIKITHLNLAAQKQQQQKQIQTLAAINLEENTISNDSSIAYYQSEQIIKKSRFIGIAKHCTSWDDAQEFVKSVKAEHPKSRHVCFGFVCGTNPVTERCSDDGEPTGTAGVPILNGINSEELSDTVCIVVRYFGGIKLGAGGLIRAYGGTARLVLREAERDILIPKSQVNVCTPSSNAGGVYAITQKYGGEVKGESYGSNGNLLANVVCNTDVLDQLIDEMRDATRGDIVFDNDDRTEVT